jgi:CheY-like chemotaxis protein
MRRRVLTIDDDPDINKLVKKALLKEEYLVETTTNFNDFFKSFNKWRPDICLVDLNLDSGNGAGFNILKAIRNKYGDEVSIIIVSRRFSEEDILRAINEGANDYITKPIDDMILISKVNSTFDDLFKESSSLPFYAIATSNRDSYIELDFELKALHEDSIMVYSSQFIAKGNSVKVFGDIADQISPDKELITIISNITKNMVDGGYNIELSFDIDDEETIKTVRQVLLGIS